ncbi:aromatic amino acid lyase [Mycolicibacterium brumae]|uniref:Uncharacterized protein n=1 Tax=Mycolicibacterium brumae TaxID=85968 RepID=A0A2G5P8F3_9MYCO|nr:aromatic amino acid lyase [Mycolicibacterium brumae]MCV7194804.1 aromatic amino acid lyase [Mycolicibacterium brumae]PIB74537.1 hypothetical protein CQY22_012615 [Mycolicibacterium brumae]UWW09552.1 aromatic amino acid lyase [Mycolicibacterium brumae]
MNGGRVEQIQALLEAGSSSEAIDLIARERAAVNTLLDDPSCPPIYGFTTLLGHLDSTAALLSDQRQLLDAHLVGPVVEFPSAWGLLLNRVKLTQLSRGGSGIHPETHERLIALSGAPDSLSWSGNWMTSYGSGDVVPGAWFVEGLRNRGVIDLSHRGDLIALINGHFVSTAAGLVVSDHFSALTAESIDIIKSVSEAASPGRNQRPVTLRDITPITLQIERSVDNLFTALLDRLSTPSCNPIFRFSPEDPVTAHSQSSFLDYRLTGALSQAIQTSAQTGTYLKAAIHAATAADATDARARLQPTKIAEALLREIAAFSIPTHFSLQESRGVEDVADLSLVAARTLASVLDRLDSLLDLATSTVAPGSDRCRRSGPLGTAVKESQLLAPKLAL